MITKYTWLFALVFCFVTSVASANTVCSPTVADCVPRVGTVHDLQNADLSGASYTSIYLVSYGTSAGVVTPGDGADPPAPTVKKDRRT